VPISQRNFFFLAVLAMIVIDFFQYLCKTSRQDRLIESEGACMRVIVTQSLTIP
jgi:hypothetical protein